MRLFIAVSLPALWKDRMDMATYYLRNHTEHCIPTPRGNFHITLAFLGETDDGRAPAVVAAMDRVRSAPFSLVSTGIGQFHLKEGDLWWMGVEPSPALMEFQSRLAAALREEGFPVSDKPYQPHASLARQVRLAADFDMAELERLLPPMTFDMSYMTLFRSEWDRGRLVYTPLHRTMLDLS